MCDPLLLLKNGIQVIILISMMAGSCGAGQATLFSQRAHSGTFDHKERAYSQRLGCQTLVIIFFSFLLSFQCDLSTSSHHSGIFTLLLSCKQVITIRKRSMRQVKEFIIKHTVGAAEAKGNGIPVKRHQTYQLCNFHHLSLNPIYIFRSFFFFVFYQSTDHIHRGHVSILLRHVLDENVASYGGVALSGTLDLVCICLYPTHLLFRWVGLNV